VVFLIGLVLYIMSFFIDGDGESATE